MKKKSKIFLVLMVVLLVVSMVTNVYATVNGNITLNVEKSTYAKNDVFSVDVKLSDLQADKGIIACSGILDYDKTNLELTKFEGKNGWSTPSYNEENGKFVSDRNTYSPTEEVLFTLTFKVIGENANNVKIKLTNLEISNGTLGEAADATKLLTISTVNNAKPETNDPAPDNNTNTNNATPGNNTTNTNTNTNTNKNTNTNNTNTANNTNNTSKNTNTNASALNITNTSNTDKATGAIPKAGEKSSIAILLSSTALIGASVFSYIKFLQYRAK